MIWAANSRWRGCQRILRKGSPITSTLPPQERREGVTHSPRTGLRSARNSPISSGSVPIWLADDPCRRSAKRDHDGLLGTPCNSIQLGFSLRFSAADFGGFFEIEPRRVTATLPEIAIGLSRNSSLCLSDRLDNCLCLLHEFIEPPASNGIAACIYEKRSFDKIAGRHTAHCVSIVRAHSCASGSSRGMAMSADVSTIIAATRVRHTAGKHGARTETAP